MILKGNLFRNVVSAAGKFPDLGDFAGAGNYILRGRDGVFTINATGTVNAWAKCRIRDGELKTVAVDARFLIGFATSLCDPKRTVELNVERKVLTISSGRNEASSAVKPAILVKSPDAARDRVEVEVTEDLARRCNYLADVAFADSSRAELSCVMLAEDSAMACNQTLFASFSVGALKNRVPIPLQVARVLAPGDKLYIGQTDTILRTFNALYLAPAAVRAQAEYPLRAFRKYSEQSVSEIAVCSGEKLAEALSNSAAMLEALSRLEVVISLRIGQKSLWVTGMNSGAKLRTRVPMVSRLAAGVFRLSLGEAKKILPFLKGDVTLTRGRRGDLLMKMKDGWILFAAWVKPEK